LCYNYWGYLPITEGEIYLNKKGIIGFLFLILLVSFISGCSSSDSATLKDKKPDKVHHNFLLFKEDHVNEDGESIGDLYIQSLDSEREKIASDVVQSSYVYVNSKDKVLFLDEESNLYEFKVGKDKVKLADEVYYFDGQYSEDIVTYLNNDSDLYLIKDGEEEKIASEVNQKEIVGDDIYYSDYDGNFSVYNMESRQESSIADDVTYFQLLNKDGDTVYLNDDSMLYYKKAGEESVKVSGEEIDPSFIQFADKNVMYLDYDGALYASQISSNEVETKRIASDISYFTFQDGTFYYVNNSGNLYKKSTKDDSATKLASDVVDYRLIDGTMYFTNEDATLYKLTSKEEKEKIATDVYFYDESNGDIVYVNADNELFVNKTKVASGIQEYAYYYGNLAYSTNDEKLYLMEGLKDPKVAIKDLGDYSTASYQNQIVFNNTLDFEDISGFWRIDNDEESLFVEIKKDGTMVNYFDDSTLEMTIDYAGYQSMDVSVEGEYMTFTRIDNKSMMVHDDYDEYTMTKSSKEEADEYVKDVLYEQDADEISTLIADYLTAFSNAVYYGETYELGYYIDEDSEFYQQQADYVMKQYDNSIEVEVLDYQINDIKSIDKDTYEAVVDEQYSIRDLEEDTEDTVNQTSIYTLKRMDGYFYITNFSLSN
jgi:hypothetical protein